MAPGGNVCSYDVFINFCGEDTRNSFTDHLYHKLVEAGIRTFRDNEGIHKGGELKSEFEGAIKESRASIVVLSKNYATSTWCLDELLLILGQRKECGHFVLPVFYGVDPTEVRNQRGGFAIEVKPSSKWSDDKVTEWKMALTDVANLAGYVVSGSESSSLKDIVGMIINELDLKEVYLPPNLIAMATHDEEIKSWLYQFDLPILVIIGMGGSGKTTLAKYMYASYKRSYDYVSFIGDVGSKCERGNDGLLEVQEQLLKDLLVGKDRKIPCVSRGTPLIEDALKTKKALIVLDDIVGDTQFVDLLGTGTINPLSKIIITTTKNPDSWRDFPHSRHQRYLMRLLNDEESLELLCRHAFRSKIPNEGFHKVVPRAIKYCGGNPLALEVLGSSLFKNDSLQFWESQLSSFGKDMDYRIETVLKKSYDSLSSNTVKRLFLHIACFFNGIDMDYAEKILEPDYSAKSGIKTLINRCLVSISPNKKLMMHRLIQDMGKNIVRRESTQPAKRSRVWHSKESYMILKRGRGSETVEGLALDMKMLKEDITFKASQLQTDALNDMDSLKLLQLNFVELNGSYENISKDLRWLCWLEFNLKTIPSDLYMANLVAIDMSYSKLEVFEPPEVLQSLQILNLKDSHSLSKISNMFNIPRLETLILWNCHNLVICEKLADLKNLNTLNMSGCQNLFNREQANMLVASTSGGVVTQQPTISFPFSIRRLFLKDCNLECTDSFPLSFSDYRYLQYLNLGNSLFESLPYYDHLKDLRVLDLSFCSRLRRLLFLPSTLAELYVYYCESLERITFQPPRFNLQEIGYEGCVNLYDVEGFFKLLPIANLEESDLGHMNWLQQYQNQQVCLVGDDELTHGRSWRIQVLYEFEIMSTSLPDIEDPNVKPEIESKSSSLSFDVPPCPINKRLNGINVTFKYELLGDDWVWFCKISTTSGVVDLMYNPKVFGKAESGEACIWLSYWPIGDKLKAGDRVHVSIVEIKGMKVHECGVSLVYSGEEPLENERRWEEILGGDLSGYQLSTGGYYLCRRDFHDLMEVDRLGPDWFTVLVGDTIDFTEVRGWRKTGRPKHMNQSFTEVKTIRCIIHGPQFEDIYNIAEISKSSIRDKSLAFTSNLLKEEMKSGTQSALIDEAQEEEKESEGMYKVLGSNEIEEIDAPPHVVRLKSVVTNELSGHAIKKIVLEVNLSDQTKIREMMKALSVLEGIESIDLDKGEGNLTVIGNVDPETLISHVRKIVHLDYSSVGPASEILEEPERITISATGEGGESSSSAQAYSQSFRQFSFEEIKSSTRNFEDGLILGRGSYGTVYKGQIYSKEGSHVVAIKRLDSMSSEVEVEFRAEIETLLKVNHRHLVSLIGYCDDNNEKILVYEYIPNGSLYDHLHEHHTLSWVTRLKIAIGVARGLEYLHHGVRFSHGVVHRNVKSITILLDQNWEPVISGFGLSIISPTNEDVQDTVKGTFGYLDTEYLLTGRLTRKTDVYSFGVVLFELLSGRHAIDKERRGDQYNLVEWAKKCVRKGNLDQLVDPNIKEMISTKCLQRFANIAYRCVHNSSEARPAMTQVTASLETLLEQHQKLKKVAFHRKVL